MCDNACAAYGWTPPDLSDVSGVAQPVRDGGARQQQLFCSPQRRRDSELDGEDVSRFHEKPADGDGWINGAFFVLEPGVIEYIEGDATSWERGSMAQLAAHRQLGAYRHRSFWQCMDTLREKRLLEELWTQGKAPWKTWE